MDKTDLLRYREEIDRIEVLLDQLKKATKYATKKRDDLQEELDNLELED